MGRFRSAINYKFTTWIFGDNLITVFPTNRQQITQQETFHKGIAVTCVSAITKTIVKKTYLDTNVYTYLNTNV